MAEKLLHEPLPPPWTYGVSKDGRVFFINDESQTTSWLHPFLGEPISTGNRPRQDLPRGWEETVTPEGAPYFVNHNERKTTFNHPSTGQPELTDDLHYLVERSPKKDQLSVSSFSTNTDMEKPNFVKKTVPKKAAPAVKRRDKSNVTVRGWLYKQDSSGLKTWRKRWCVLSDFCLFVYKSPEEENILMSVLLPSYTISPVIQEDKVHKKYAFKCEHANMMTYHFHAETEHDMNKWIKSLTLATVLRRDSGELIESRTPTENGSYREDEDDAGFKSRTLPRVTNEYGGSLPRGAPDSYNSLRSPGNDSRNRTPGDDPRARTLDHNYRSPIEEPRYRSPARNQKFASPVDPRYRSPADHSQYRSPADDRRPPADERRPPADERRPPADDRRPHNDSRTPDSHQRPDNQNQRFPDEDDDEAGFKTFSSRSRQSPNKNRPHSGPDRIESHHTQHPHRRDPSHGDHVNSRTPNPYPSRQPGNETQRPQQRVYSTELRPRDSLDSGNSGAPSSVPSSDMHPRSQSHTLPSKAHYQRSPAVRYPTMPWNASYQTPESQQIDLPPNDRSHSVKYGTLPSQSSYPVQEPRQEPIRSAEKYHTMPLRPSQQQQQQQQYYSPESLSPSSPREMQRQESLRKLHDWVKTREGSSSDALRTSTQSLPVQKTTTVNDYARRDTTTQYKSTPPQNTNTTPHRPPLPNDYSRKHKEDERLRNEEQFRNLQKKKEMEPLVFRFPETNTYQQPGKSPEQRSFLQSPVGVGTEQRTVIQSPYTFNIFSDKRPAPQQQHRQQNGHYRSPNKAPSGYYSETDATDRSHPNYSAERQVYPSHQQSERAVDSRHLYTHQEESPHALSPNRSQYSPRGTQEHTYRSQSSRSLEDIERKSRNLTDVMDLETGYHQQPQQYRNQAEDLVDKVMRRMDTKPPPGSGGGGGGGRMKKLSKKPPELMTMNGHRLRLSISAGDLMGKTHEELVLLLIQLRRNYAGMEKSKDILKQQIELEKDILAHPHGPTGNSQSYRKQYNDDFRRTQQELFEHQRKYEEMKKENDEIEKRLDVSRPLINLVDNLVKMGSLYGGENAMVVQELYKYQYQLRGDQYTPPKRLIEFSRKLQEDKLVHDHEAELKKLETKDDRDLEEKLQRLYDLDRKLQDCSTYVSGLREDMDKIEKGLERINKHLDQYRDNPTEYHEIEKQRIVLEKELVKVRAMLADGSKELETITNENMKLEHEITILRTKMQDEAERRNKSPSQESMRAKIKLEKELNQAQVIIDDLSRQKNALQAEMEQVRELAVEESKIKDLSEKTHVDDSHISGPYMVTDLDSLSTKDISQMKTPPKAAAPQRSDSFKKVQKMKKQVQQLAQPPPATQRSYSATPPKDQTYTTTQLVSSAPSRSKTKPIQVISPMQQPNRPPPPKYYQTGSDSPADATQYTPKSSASHPRTVSASDKSKHTMREVKRESERRSREKEMKKVNGDELRQRSSSADRTYTSPARKSRTLPSRRYMGVQRSPDGRSNSLGGRYDAYPRLTDQLRTTGRPSSANSDSERTTTTVTTRRQRTLSAGEDPIMHRSRVEAPLQSAPPPIPNEYRRQGGLRSTDGVNPRIRSKSAIERAAVRAKRSQTLPSGLNADSRYIVSDVDSSQRVQDDLAILDLEKTMKSLAGGATSGFNAPDYVVGENKSVVKDESTGFGLLVRDDDGNIISSDRIKPSTYLSVKNRYLRDLFFEAAGPYDKLGLPPKVWIPERYVPEDDEEELSPEEKVKKDDRVEHLKKMLSHHSLQDWHPREFMSDWYKMDMEAEVEAVKDKIEEEKHRREELLSLKAALAQEVKQATKSVAAKQSGSHETHITATTPVLQRAALNGNIYTSQSREERQATL